jgi:hypothetical protein
MQNSKIEQLINTLRQRREESQAQWKPLQPEAEALLLRIAQIEEKVARESVTSAPSSTPPPQQ